jgi:outer membrane receptor protein involved in Fe transport
LTPADPTDFSFIVKNAPQAQTYGAEFGAQARVTHGLQVYANLGALHAKITKYPGSGFQGNELPLSPRMTGAAGVTFNRHGWDASFNMRYSDSYFSDIENNPRGNVAPYWVGNAQMGWSFQHFRVYGHVENVFDSSKAVAIYSGATPAEDGANILKPRTCWLGVEWRL